ncbi:MAG: lipoprotein [Acidimicrobiales bacterium]|nr:lipoprotein [Acidimicrobiales bacterium]
MCAWSGVAAVLVVVQRVSNQWSNPAGWLRWPGVANLLSGWTQFDAWVFVDIADNGYWYRPGERSPTSFFPFFPLLVRTVRPLFDDTLLAAMAVSAAAGLAATVLLWHWMGRRGVTGTRKTVGLAVFVVYPWSWFLYGPAFSDAVFVALVIGAFLLVEHDRYVIAGLVGALATATRPTGLFLMPGLLVLALERAEVLTVPAAATGWVARLRVPIAIDRSRFRPVLLGTVLSVAGVGAYMAYLGIRFGEPLVFITDQSQYNGSGLDTLFKAGLVASWLHWDDPVHTLAITAQTLIAVGCALAIPAVARRFGWGYGLFVLSLVALPAIATRDFNSTGRYLLAAFPVAVVVAERIAERPLARTSWLLCSSACLVALTFAYAQSRMVS